MELKWTRSARKDGRTFSSNCTFMELKSWQMMKKIREGYGSNCTFMELKCWYASPILSEFRCSNCTFMELKYAITIKTGATDFVLIVPLWNWNFKVVPSPMTVQSSNCTFMELKWKWFWTYLPFWICSNCTFMELKYGCHQHALSHLGF